VDVFARGRKFSEERKYRKGSPATAETRMTDQELITRLRPVSFDWKQTGERDLGLVAEEVASVEPLLVTHDDRGEIEGVKYERVAVVLVNARSDQCSSTAGTGLGPSLRSTIWCVACAKGAKKIENIFGERRNLAELFGFVLKRLPVHRLPSRNIVETVSKSARDDCALASQAGGLSRAATLRLASRRELLVAARNISCDADDLSGRDMNDRAAAVARNECGRNFNAVRSDSNEFAFDTGDHSAATAVSKDDDVVTDSSNAFEVRNALQWESR